MIRHAGFVALLLGCFAQGFVPAAARAEAVLKLEKGDHVCLIGNTLAERMQYFGNFETLLHSRFPTLELSVRNLGYSADELTVRLRSANFGTPDDHLTHSKADVVLAFFGYGESFAGEKGLTKFENDLDSFIKQTLAKKYNGRSAPRLVLLSPIAFENLGTPYLPDGVEINKNLAAYTGAMAKIAARHNVGFVDLFAPTSKLMAAASNKLTFNGCHLTESGDKLVAPLIVEGLFGKANGGSSPDYAKVRAEVSEKDFQWFHRYRAVNGFYIYGGRSLLDFGHKDLSNRTVMENERKKLDDMCAVRDQRIWAVAQGKTVSEAIDDSGTTPLMPVPTNFTREIKFLASDEAVNSFTLPKGYEIRPFASEVEFPDLANPVQMTFDAKGRLWVCTMQSYPQYKPPMKPNDKVLILEDTDRDGRADKCTVFAEGLHIPTGLELCDGGVLVAQQPNLMFLKDTDGDGKADYREIVLHGFDSADSHHSISAFVTDPGGAVYFQEGTFHHTQVETPQGNVRVANAAVFRYEPRTHKLDVFVSYAFANPWGHIFDRWGQNFVSDASGGANYFGTAFSGHVEHPRKHKGMKQFLQMQYRPTAGCEIVTSRHFPDEAQGNFLLNNCIGFQGVAQYKMKEDQSGFKAEPVEPLLKSNDPNFRPVDIEFAPDGSLYLVDWYNPLIGHMQHHIRDPNRDTTHGRIWRITYKGRDLVKPAEIAGQPIPKLLDLLKTYEDRTRYRVRQELRERPTADVIAGLKTWIAGLDRNDPEYQHHLLEALWVQQHHHAVDEAFLKQMLRSPDYRARAAATRVLCYVRDKVKNPLDLLEVQAGDEHPRVRLEAVRACSFFTGKDATKASEVALVSLTLPQDDYLKYCFEETMATLSPYLK